MKLKSLFEHTLPVDGKFIEKGIECNSCNTPTTTCLWVRILQICYRWLSNCQENYCNCWPPSIDYKPTWPQWNRNQARFPRSLLDKLCTWLKIAHLLLNNILKQLIAIISDRSVTILIATCLIILPERLHNLNFQIFDMWQFHRFS